MPAAAVPAIGAGTLVVDLLVGVVLFVVVVTVTAVLMSLLQAVLPRTDSGADAVDAGRGAEPAEEERSEPSDA